ncbi:MAG: hypothetical protein VZQ55_07295, partial [Ruminococcus sp.]|nr:hypothetical protein [Ruminococcus sp.]
KQDLDEMLSLAGQQPFCRFATFSLSGKSPHQSPSVTASPLGEAESKKNFFYSQKDRRSGLLITEN